jgi:5-methylcytosine-specific restriction endonuclease McrA
MSDTPAPLEPDPAYTEWYRPPGKRKRAAVMERDSWTCHICGEPIDPTLACPDRMAGVCDHIIPRYYGGQSALDNLAAAHNGCNSRKGIRTPGGRFGTARAGNATKRGWRR